MRRKVCIVIDAYFEYCDCNRLADEFVMFDAETTCKFTSNLVICCLDTGVVCEMVEERPDTQIYGGFSVFRAVAVRYHTGVNQVPDLCWQVTKTKGHGILRHGFLNSH
jgi:hypothetical protein